MKVALRNLVEIKSGHSPSVFNLTKSGEIPYVKVEDMNNCAKYQKESRNYCEDIDRAVPVGSIIFPKRGASIMNNKVRIAATDICMDTNMMAIIPNENIISEFLYYVITYERLSRIADTSTIPQINNKHIHPYKISLPTIVEQKAIADLLSTWDTAIEKIEQLIQVKQMQYRHLVQKLIHQVDGYDAVELRDITLPITTKNTIGETNVLTSSAVHGLISQLEYYKKSVSADDVSGYYLLQRGDFAYNRSSATGYPYGAIKRLDRYERGVLSTLYLGFRITNLELVDSNYLADLFEAGVLNKQLRGICQAGARSHGLLNVTKADFFLLKVPLPSMSKQKEIAVKLDLARKEIELLESLKGKYKMQKRGLMQKLLTGEWRVKTNEAAA